MKMNFLQRSNTFLNKHREKKGSSAPILIVIFLVLVFILPWSRNFIFDVAFPFWNVRDNVVKFVSDNSDYLKTKADLISENLFFKDQIEKSKKDSAIYALVVKENEDLKNILSRKKTEQKLLLSSILVKPFLSPYDTLIIDVGSSSLVSVGDKILADGNSYIGYISEVYNNTSKVVLYSSPGEKVKVLIGNNNILKEAIGKGGGNFGVEMPRESDIKEGDSIIMPSISTNIFGIVEKVEFKESDSFQNVLFKSPVNISELKWVEVVLSLKK